MTLFRSLRNSKQCTIAMEHPDPYDGKIECISHMYSPLFTASKPQRIYKRFLLYSSDSVTFQFDSNSYYFLNSPWLPKVWASLKSPALTTLFPAADLYCYWYNSKQLHNILQNLSRDLKQCDFSRSVTQLLILFLSLEAGLQLIGNV